MLTSLLEQTAGCASDRHSLRVCATATLKGRSYASRCRRLNSEHKGLARLPVGTTTCHMRDSTVAAIAVGRHFCACIEIHLRSGPSTRPGPRCGHLPTASALAAAAAAKLASSSASVGLLPAYFPGGKLSRLIVNRPSGCCCALPADENLYSLQETLSTGFSVHSLTSAVQRA